MYRSINFLWFEPISEQEKEGKFYHSQCIIVQLAQALYPVCICVGASVWTHFIIWTRRRLIDGWIAVQSTFHMIWLHRQEIFSCEPLIQTKCVQHIHLVFHMVFDDSSSSSPSPTLNRWMKRGCETHIKKRILCTTPVSIERTWVRVCVWWLEKIAIAFGQKLLWIQYLRLYQWKQMSMYKVTLRGTWGFRLSIAVLCAIEHNKPDYFIYSFGTIIYWLNIKLIGGRG